MCDHDDVAERRETFGSNFGVVMIVQPSARFTRSLIGSGPKAEKSGAVIAPTFSVPKTAK
jgi:hypothetical protein